jgi:hypothetical protein
MRHELFTAAGLPVLRSATQNPAKLGVVTENLNHVGEFQGLDLNAGKCHSSISPTAKCASMVQAESKRIRGSYSPVPVFLPFRQTECKSYHCEKFGMGMLNDGGANCNLM